MIEIQVLWWISLSWTSSFWSLSPHSLASCGFYCNTATESLVSQSGSCFFPYSFVSSAYLQSRSMHHRVRTTSFQYLCLTALTSSVHSVPSVLHKSSLLSSSAPWSLLQWDFVDCQWVRKGSSLLSSHSKSWGDLDWTLCFQIASTLASSPVVPVEFRSIFFSTFVSSVRCSGSTAFSRAYSAFPPYFALQSQRIHSDSGPPISCSPAFQSVAWDPTTYKVDPLLFFLA